MISLIEYESCIDGEDNEALFPLTLTSCIGGDSVLYYEKYAWDAAVALVRTAHDMRFSEDTALLIKRIIEPEIRHTSLSLSSEAVIGYTFPEDGKVPDIYGKSRQVTRDDNFENLTDFDIDPLGEGWRYFATVIDGKICSVACENPHFDSQYADIGVCTAPQYRGKGYASANVAALAKLLLEEVCTVTYSCAMSNEAAARTAEKAGFRRTHNALYIYAEPSEE